MSVPGWSSDAERGTIDAVPTTPQIARPRKSEPPDQRGSLSWAPHTGWAWTHKVLLHFRQNDGPGIIQNNYRAGTGQKKLFYPFEEVLGTKTLPAVPHTAWQDAVGLNPQNQREFSWSTPNYFQHPAHHNLHFPGMKANITEFSTEVISVLYAHSFTLGIDPLRLFCQNYE